MMLFVVVVVVVELDILFIWESPQDGVGIHHQVVHQERTLAKRRLSSYNNTNL